MTVDMLKDVLSAISDKGHGDAKVAVKWDEDCAWDSPEIINVDLIVRMDSMGAINNQILLLYPKD